MSSSCYKKVLTIQSHVVYGYVGNKSATLPLQLFRFDVDPLNVVQFSNHTGYPIFKGRRSDVEDVKIILDGLIANDMIDEYTHILTGYIGNKDILKLVGEFIDRVKVSNPNCKVLIDPVMGDFGHLYVSETVIPEYRNDLLKRADIALPNWFEAELLVDFKIKNEDNALKALEVIHKLGPKIVIITSVPIENDDDHLTLFASNKLTGDLLSIRFEKKSGIFTGTGDLLAALLLARLEEDNNDKFEYIKLENFAKSVLLALSTMQHVLEATIERSQSRLGDKYSTSDMVRGKDAFRHRANELAVVYAQDGIINPSREIIDKLLLSTKSLK